MVDLNIETKGNIIIMHISGAFNIETMTTIENGWKEQIEKKPEVIAINCRKIDQIDSTAIGALVRYLNISMKHNIALIFYDLNETIQELFETSKLNKFFTIMDLAEFERTYL
ncbi:MAG: STAS domain-containing protein [bacterium]|nr:STAS domain-containing protein [bacterium]